MPAEPLLERATAAPQRVERAEREDEPRRPALQRFRAILEPFDAESGRGDVRAQRLARRDPPRPAAGAAIDVAQRQPTAAPQRAAPFGEGQSAIGGQRQAAFRQHAVEAFVGERQPGGVGDDERRRLAARAGVGRDDDIDADRRDAALTQQARRSAQAAADVGDRVAGAETGAIDQFSRQRQTAGAQRLAGAVAQRAAAEQPVSRWRRAEHHLSSSACSTFSMRPRASSSET